MAFVGRAFWQITFTFLDNNGKAAFCSTMVPGNMALADVETRITALAAALQAVSDASLTSANVNRQYVNDTPQAAIVSSEVERKLVIPLGTATLASATSLEVPSPIFTMEIDGTDVVNQQNAALVTLVGLLTAGALGPGDGSVTHYGDDITRAKAAYISHRYRKPR